MTISITAGALKDAIRKALKAIPKPSSDNDLKGMLTLGAADGNVHIHAREEGQAVRVLASSSIEPGQRMQVGVNAKNLERLMNAFADAAIVKIAQEKTGLVLRVGRSKMVLPQLTEMQKLIFDDACKQASMGEVVMTVQASLLAAAIHAVEHVAARGDVRPYLCGVLFDFTSGKLCLRASNGNGMLIYETSTAVDASHGQLILPIGFAEPLATLLAKEEGEVQLSLVKKETDGEVISLVAETPTLRYRSQLVGGKYPHLKLEADKVSDFKRPLVVSTDALRSALERLSIVGSAVSKRGIAMQVVSNELRLQLDDDDSVEYVPVVGQDTGVVGARVDILLGMLERMAAPQVTFMFPEEAGANKPFLLGDPDETQQVMFGVFAQYTLAEGVAQAEKQKQSNVKTFPTKEEVKLKVAA